MWSHCQGRTKALSSKCNYGGVIFGLVKTAAEMNGNVWDVKVGERKKKHLPQPPTECSEQTTRKPPPKGQPNKVSCMWPFIHKDAKQAFSSCWVFLCEKDQFPQQYFPFLNKMFLSLKDGTTQSLVSDYHGPRWKIQVICQTVPRGWAPVTSYRIFTVLPDGVKVTQQRNVLFLILKFKKKRKKKQARHI